jgi:hypothetical protein
MTNGSSQRNENTAGLRVNLMADRRLYAILAAHFFDKRSNRGPKKVKEPKRKNCGMEGGRLVETAAAEEIE